MLETEDSRTFAAVDHAQHTNRRGCSGRQPISISATAADVKNRRSASSVRRGRCYDPSSALAAARALVPAVLIAKLTESRLPELCPGLALLPQAAPRLEPG